ncbi:MAG: TIGR02206 family membrane protein [Ruminococcaceae bacterium]|nr:TIGR02206 family membrane protein [Oscillospiraceae bacterium]
MKEFFAYFFGQGTTEEFKNFSLAHLIPIFVMIGGIFLIYKFRNELRESKYESTIRMALAFAMIVSEMSYYWRLVGMPELGPNAADHLPITVCGWVIVFGSFMLLSKSQTLFDICYFWVFSGSIFALITPTVITFTGPTRFRYYQFWAEHTLGYIAVFYMIFVFGMRPTVRSAIKAYVSLAALAVIAYFANDMIGNGANYLFMARPESTPSILDILPPNFVLRIFIMALAVTILFFVSYLPWLIKDRKAKKSEILEAVK